MELKHKKYIFKNQATEVLFFDKVQDLFLNITKQKNVFFIIDKNVFELYKLHELRLKNVYILKATEKNKSFKAVIEICNKMQMSGVNRSWRLVGIGGGLTTDISGFVASIYMRGIRLELIPTTLTASVDAAFGGKNGINFNVKNYLGTFNHPSKILVCPDFTHTLGKAEISAGLVEALKKGLLFNSELTKNTLQAASQLRYSLMIDKELLKKIIFLSIETKMKVVKKDELDTGLRKSLNFGHTIGHALEAVLLDKISHGQAVAFGMVAESYICFKEGYLSQEECNHVKNLVTQVFDLKNLPKFKIEELVKKVKFDKKNKNNFIMFAVPKSVEQTKKNSFHYQLVGLKKETNLRNIIKEINF